MPSEFESWGRIPQVSQRVFPINWLPDRLPKEPSLLPRGAGRSYGDVCLNDHGTLLYTGSMNRLINFDRENGVIKCEAGTLLEDVLSVSVPSRWFLPVTPGTKFVTVAGAVANDVHGKNHHRAGTFGRHVTRFELLRSDGRKLECSPDQNEDFFRASIGGMGLTGFMTWVEFKLHAIPGPMIEMETIQFKGLDDFFELSDESDSRFEYTVSWIDCLARGKNLGRGLFMRGNHLKTNDSSVMVQKNKFSIPFDFPQFVLNPFTVRAFNWAYYQKQRKKITQSHIHYDPFFYPLDSILRWNRMYGKAGFFQYQAVVPLEADGIRLILDAIARSGEGSFLAVLKTFGNVTSPGMLSFPRPGVTLALDFANRGERTLALFNRLDAIVRDHGGAVYPAKDARMSASDFQAFFPAWKEFSKYIDPAFSSSFWRRVKEEK